MSALLAAIKYVIMSCVKIDQIVIHRGMSRVRKHKYCFTAHKLTQVRSQDVVLVAIQYDVVCIRIYYNQLLFFPVSSNEFNRNLPGVK